ncbi:MAG: terminase large subunit domain-containing protein [Ktedonobacterales bacterium]
MKLLPQAKEAKVQRALTLIEGLVLDDDGTRLGDVLTDEQRAFILAVLRGEATWYWYGAGRGWGKTTLSAALAIAFMLVLLPRTATIDCYAADRDQAALIHEAVCAFIDRTPELRGALKPETTRVTAPARGVTLFALAADGPSAYGRKPHVVFLDELCQWADVPRSHQVHEAVTTGVGKVRGARCIVTTTAGSPDHFSWKDYSHFSASPLGHVMMLHEPPPWMPQSIVEDQRKRLTESAFARLYLNEWTQADESAFPLDDVLACAVLTGPTTPRPRTRRVVTCDAGWRHDATVVVLASVEERPNRNREPEPVLVINQVHRIVPTKARTVDFEHTEKLLENLARTYNAPVVVDPAQMVAVMQNLEKHGIEVRQHTFSQSSNTRLAMLLLELVRTHRLEMPNSQELVNEFTSVRIVESQPGVYRVDTRPGKEQRDDQVVSIGMAAVELVPTDIDRLVLYQERLGLLHKAEAETRLPQTFADLTDDELREMHFDDFTIARMRRGDRWYE